MPVVVTAKTKRPSEARSRERIAFQRSSRAGGLETEATASVSVIMPLLNRENQPPRDPQLAAKVGRARSGCAGALRGGAPRGRCAGGLRGGALRGGRGVLLVSQHHH